MFDLHSLSKKVRGLYFAGEVLDIDGETGGSIFNQPGQLHGWPRSILVSTNDDF